MNLFNDSEKTYGDDYRSHILEQWKTAVEMSNSLSDRRTNMNNIFLTINAILIALITFELEKKSIGFAVVGVMICVIWLANLSNYKKLNSAKFKVINELEKKLPANVFDCEWEIVGRGEDGKKYKRMSQIEKLVPCIFMLVYIVAILCPLIF